MFVCAPARKPSSLQKTAHSSISILNKTHAQLHSKSLESGSHCQLVQSPKVPTQSQSVSSADITKAHPCLLLSKTTTSRHGERNPILTYQQSHPAHHRALRVPVSSTQNRALATASNAFSTILPSSTNEHFETASSMRTHSTSKSSPSSCVSVIL